MSVEVVRNALLDEKKKQIRSATVARKRVLLGLYRATFNPPNLGAPLSPISPDETDFLNANDLDQGRHFDESSIPVHDICLPPNTKDVLSAGTSVLPSSPLSPAYPVAELNAHLQPPRSPAPTEGLDPTKPKIKAPDAPKNRNQGGLSPLRIPGDSVREDGPSARPQELLQPTRDDSLRTSPTGNHEHNATGRSNTVHLPPQEVQEKRLNDIQKAQEEERRRERREDESLHLGAALNGAELASSPSSTVGAHSTFTPKALNHSPDTSPDVDSRALRMGDDNSANSEDSTFRESTASAVKSQLDSARPPTRASSPDAQLRLEEQEASRVAHQRDSQLRRMPPKDSELTEEAQEFVKESKQADLEAKETDVDVREDANMLSQALDNSTDTISVKPNQSQASRASITEDVDMIGNRDTSYKTEGSGALPIESPTQKSSSERMQTRVSSGAMRQKSVTELLSGGRPSFARQSTAGSAISHSSQAVTPTSNRKERETVATSTALIQRRDSNKMVDPLRNYSDDYAALKGASQDESKDYLVPLFMYQAHTVPRAQSLPDLVAGASKTVSTLGLQAMLRESQDYRILKRIYQLQNANRWSFRQMEKCQEPPRPACHLDHLLSEMKWMRTDFREERKFNLVVARNLATWCADWVAADDEGRKALQVTVTPTNVASDNSMDLGDDVEPPPELVPSGANETDSEASLEEPATIISSTLRHSSVLFNLGLDDTLCQLEGSPITNALLQELPAYKPRARRRSLSRDRSALPVSKLLTGKLVSRAQGPPRKRSRYEYEEEDPDRSPPTPKRRNSEDGPYSFTPTRRTSRLELPADEADLALFLPENKHVRDRLHAGHAFRPPSEFGMPSTSFFESRSSSHWLWKEDQELRTLVKEYSFNWSLISAEMVIPSRNTSGAERRTPWECFERWVQLEGLPAEMSKTQYFKTYQARLEAAARTVAQLHAAQQQAAQAQTPGAIQSVRKRTTQPFRVDRRKNSKYLAAIDGMRKLARKRETQTAKHQENARAAQLRKAAEQQQPKAQMQTPAEFSRLRYERDLKMMERQEQARLQWLQAQQRNAALQRQMGPNPQVAQQAAMQAAAQQQRNGVQGNSQGGTQQANMAGPAPNGQMQQGNNMQPRMQGQHPMQNGMSNGNTMQANMQMPGMQENMRILMQQRQMTAAQAQQAQAMQGLQGQNLANAHLAGGFGMQNLQNQQLMKQMAQAGFGGSNMGGNMGNNMSNNMQAASPSGQQQGPQQLSSGHMPIIKQLVNQIMKNNPGCNEAQATQMAAKELQTRAAATARQNALNAAAGAATANMTNHSMNGMNMNMNMGMNMGMGMGMNNMNGMNNMSMGYGGATSPGSMSVPMNLPNQGSGTHGPGSVSPVQHYTQNLRMQQQQQSAQRQMAGSPAMGMSNLADSRSATPSQAQHQRMGSGSAMENSLSPGGGRPGSMHGSVGGNG